MEGIDQELQARVWSRVSGKGELPAPAGRFSELTGELAACYRHFGRKIPAFRDLERKVLQNQNQIFSLQALRGIRESRRLHNIPMEDLPGTMERCCHLERRLAAELERFAGDPEWGEVFAMLARQARQRCLAVLALRGRRG